MISDAALLEAVAQGVSAQQLVAMIIADRDAARARRTARQAARAALQNPDKPGQVESGLPVVPFATGGARKDQARRGLGMALWLTPAAKDVGAYIIDRCVGAEGRHEVGIEKMAERTGLSDRSVRRALAELDRLGLVSREIHGGRRHVNAYRPNWEALARAGLVARPAGNPDTEAKPGLNRPNLAASTESPFQTSLSPRKGQRGREPDRRQREMVLPVVIDGGRGRGQVAADAARQRLAADLTLHASKFGPRGGKELIAGIPPEAWEAGKAAEMNRAGSGLRVLLDTAFEMQTRPAGQATG